MPVEAASRSTRSGRAAGLRSHLAGKSMKRFYFTSYCTSLQGTRMMRTTGSWPRPVRATRKGRVTDLQSTTETEDEYDLTFIADLNNQQIHRMTHQELLGVINAARPMFLNERCSNRLTYLDQATLERLAFLARYCCQNQRARTLNSGNECHARTVTQAE